MTDTVVRVAMALRLQALCWVGEPFVEALAQADPATQ